MNNAELARAIDHTCLSAEATSADIERLCAEAKEHGFATVCVASRWVSLAAQSLANTPVGVCTVVGFPHGDASARAKAAEAVIAVEDGATEIDMVIARGALKEGHDEQVQADIRAVVQAVPQQVVKVILETASLDTPAIERACALAVAAGAGFVKTSTGFGGGGASEGAVRTMRRCVGDALGVKASGGIRDAEAARRMIEAGASRLGTSAGVAIVSGGHSGADY